MKRFSILKESLISIINYLQTFTSKYMSSTQTMNTSDLFELKENYVNHIIDGMDIDTLCAYAKDCMLNGTDGISEWNESEIKEEIVEMYGEDILEDLTPCSK